MTEARSQHRLGIALVVAAAVAWSTAPFFTRLLPYNSWTILFWRGLFAGGMIMVLMVLLQGRASLRDLVRIDINGWLVASFSTLAMIAFIPSLQLTDVSNVAIIIATGPFLAAGLAWVWLKEIPHRRTLLASAVALVGVVIIVGGVRAGADILGVALAMLHGAGDRGDDGDGAAAPEYTDDRSRRAVQLSGQRHQPSLRPRDNSGQRLRLV